MYSHLFLLLSIMLFPFSNNPQPVRNTLTACLSLGLPPLVPGDSSPLDATSFLHFQPFWGCPPRAGGWFLEEQLKYQPQRICDLWCSFCLEIFSDI